MEDNLKNEALHIPLWRIFWVTFFFARIIEMKAYLLINDQSIMMDTKLTGCKYISMNRKLLINCTGQQTN